MASGLEQIRDHRKGQTDKGTALATIAVMLRSEAARR
jgi:hypothetical protein